MTQLAEQSQSNKVLASIYLAYQSFDLDVTPLKGQVILNDLKLLGAPENEIVEAIKLGRIGTYGKTYKINSNEICNWVRKYLDDITLKETSMEFDSMYHKESEECGVIGYDKFVLFLSRYSIKNRGFIDGETYERLERTVKTAPMELEDYIGILSTRDFKGDLLYNLVDLIRKDKHRNERNKI